MSKHDNHPVNKRSGRPKLKDRRLFLQGLQALHTEGLTTSVQIELAVLLSLQLDQGILGTSVGILAQHLGLSDSVVSTAGIKLVSLGLAERLEDDEDMRKVRLTPTRNLLALFDNNNLR